MRSARLLALGAALLGACGGGEDAAIQVEELKERDWDEHPAVVVTEACSPTYALSDVHGGYERMAKLLAAHGLADGEPSAPTEAVWSGGSACLVVVGDLINKGPDSLATLEFLRELQHSAEERGGTVVTLLGNHEVELINDPENDKAEDDDGINEELRDEGIEPRDFARGADPRGKWLRNRPLAALVGRWFFAHAGNSAGRTVEELEAALRAAGQQSYEGPDGIGPDSIVEARDFWQDDPSTASRYVDALGAAHIVFGHDPDALGPRGEIAFGEEGLLARIDCGMSPYVDDSKGRLLRIWHLEGEDVAESLEPDGDVSEIWRGAP